MVKCFWYDDSNYKRSDCGLYTDAMKNGIITFKEDKIRDSTMIEPLKTNL